MTTLKVRHPIGGKMYDTMKAEEVHRIPGKVYEEDTRLYRSPKGQWFLAGKGDASSRWADKTPGGYISGKGIELLSDQEAQKLMEETDGPVEDYFKLEEG